MKLPKLPKTNIIKLGSQGMSHIVVPLVVVVLVAIGGTYMLVASHASTCPPGKAPVYNSSPTSGHTCWPVQTACQQPAPLSYDCPKTASTVKPKVAHSAHPIAPPSAAKLKAQDKARQTAAGNNAANAAPAVASSDNPPPAVASTSSFTSLPAVQTSKPEVNIVVITYVKDGNDRQRIGDVKVKIAREGGNEQCNTHSNNTATTNAVKFTNHVLVHGTAHFLGCTAGKYTVTAIGRKGYTIISDKTKIVNLTAQDQTARVHFVLQKNPPKTAASSAVQPTVVKSTP